MKTAIKYLTFLNMSALLLLALSGVFDGAFGRILYICSFALPLLLSLPVMKKTGAKFMKFRTGRGDLWLFVPLILPSVLLIFSLSLLTSLILSSLGLSDSYEIEQNLLLALFNHALVPAILEEGLFRFVALSILLPYSKRGAVIYSAIFFAFAHCNLFQIPYAFLAGLIFAFLDVAFDSVLPSVILHFVNNALSVLWIMYGEANLVLFVSVFLGLTLLSVLAAVIFCRRRYKNIFSIGCRAEEKIAASPYALIFIAVTLLVAITAVL